MSETLKRSVSEAEIMRAMGPASYELMESLDPTRNHVFTAIDQIGGARLAGAYLVGAAEHESLRNTENPLATALGNVTHALGYRLQGSGDNSEVLDLIRFRILATERNSSRQVRKRRDPPVRFETPPRPGPDGLKAYPPIDYPLIA